MPLIRMPPWSLSASEMDRPLSGPDHFHGLVDRAMRARGQAGNISRMCFDLGTADADAVAAALRASPVVRSVARVRWRTRWPRLPRWHLVAEAPDVVRVQRTDDAGTWLAQRLQEPLGRDGLLRFDVRAGTGATQVLVSFHHALFDHQGMLNLLHAVEAGGWHGPAVPPVDRAPGPGAWREAIACAATAFRTAGPRLGSLWVPGHAGGPPRYHVLRFTAAETARIDARARAAGASLSRNAWIQAVVAHLVQATLQRRGRPAPYLWFSAPVDQRPRTGVGHLLTNLNSYFFFRLERAQLQDPVVALGALNAQFVAQVRTAFPQRYRSLLRAFRHPPAWLASAMFSLPSLGRWSSFGHSDLGDLDRMPTTFTGMPIAQVLHLPPVPAPPGLSVVTGREGGALLMVIGHQDRSLDDQGSAAFRSALRDLLLGA